MISTMEDVKRLIGTAAEGRTIEFKERLPGNSDGERKEFLADVSSFANTAGGELLFGVTEEQSIAADATGIATSDADAEILRLDEQIREGIAPRIPGVRIKSIGGFPRGPVLVIHIPKSWASPHMVRYKNSSRFYARNNKGKYQLDVAEIRAAFILSEAIPERIREFRLDRLARINAGETPVRIHDKPKVVLHVASLGAFSSSRLISPAEWRAQRDHLSPLGGGGGYLRYNMDGLMMASSEDGACRAYCQTFRSGIIETVHADMASHSPDRKLIASSTFEEEIIRSVDEYFAALTNLGFPPPFLIFLTLMGFEGYAMASRNWRDIQATIDRDVTALPEVLVDDLSTPIHQIMRPVIDMAWNAAGWEGSPNYDENGNWKLP